MLKVPSTPLIPTIQGGGWPPPSITLPGSGSLYFDGANSIQYSPSADWALGTEDFTIECFVYNGKGSVQAGAPRIWSIGDWPDTDVGISLENEALFWIGGELMIVPFDFTARNWFHMCLMRVAGVTGAYLNGQLVASISNEYDLSATGKYLTFGAEYQGSSVPWKGWISNFRFVKGVAVHNAGGFGLNGANLSTVAGCKLLLQTASAETAYDDSSGTNKEYYAIGTVPWQQRSPF